MRVKRWKVDVQDSHVWIFAKPKAAEASAFNIGYLWGKTSSIIIEFYEIKVPTRCQHEIIKALVSLAASLRVFLHLNWIRLQLEVIFQITTLWATKREGAASLGSGHQQVIEKDTMMISHQKTRKKNSNAS